MKVLLLSDIHGNADALAAVLAEAGDQMDAALLTGDFVGYYYAPDRCLQQLDRLPRWEAVRGNHEDMLAAARTGRRRDEIRAKYGSGIDMALRVLDPADQDRLLALPQRRRVELGGRTALLCHGAPWDADAYIYPDAPAEDRSRMMAEDCDLLVFGHTHYQTMWREGARVAVNPGSVGQPRDGGRSACWALWDTTTNNVELRRTAWDPAPVMAECRRRDPHVPYLADILVRGA